MKMACRCESRKASIVEAGGSVATAFKGLTWDHPRGYDALAFAAASARNSSGLPLVSWSRQPLEDFESHPIGDLASRYDLIVIDHPHVGDAVQHSCLRPLEDVFDTGVLEQWRRQTAGQAMESYLIQGRHWAIPLDVACQVAASRADLLSHEPPDDWDGVLKLSGQRPVALSLAGPHALLTFFSICLSLGTEPCEDDLAPTAPGVEALSLIKRLHRNANCEFEGLNPIGLLERMSTSDDIALVPLIFGYVTYSRRRSGRHAIQFSGSPKIGRDGRRGSVLGGTGIALTSRCQPTAQLVEHLRSFMDVETQRALIPDHEGQPSASSAWEDERLNAECNNFYNATRSTLEDAWVRPRFSGYVAFQDRASAVLRASLDADESPSYILDRLRLLWIRAAASARV